MKIYIRADSMITKADYKGALLTLKLSTKPAEISKAQEVIRKYRESNPESAAKVDEELANRPRKPYTKSKSKLSKYRW